MHSFSLGQINNIQAVTIFIGQFHKKAVLKSSDL